MLKVRIAGFDQRRLRRIRATPLVHLRLAELCHRLRLVLTLKRPVVPLVQPPIFDDRNLLNFV